MAGGGSGGGGGRGLMESARHVMTRTVNPRF